MTKDRHDLEQRLEELGRAIGAGGSVADSVMSRIQQIPQSDRPKPVEGRIQIRRRIMNNIGKLAVAAVLVAGATLGIMFFEGSGSITLAEVAGTLERIDSFRYRASMTMSGLPGMPEGTTQQMSMEVLFDAEHGMIMDSSMGGQTAATIYLLPGREQMLTLMPEQKRYMTVALTDELLQQTRQQNGDPRIYITEMMRFDPIELPRTTIRGHTVQGLQVEGPAFGGGIFDDCTTVLWVDVKSRLPVEMTMDCSTDEGAAMTMVMDHFEWNIDVDPQRFAVEIPEDYKSLGEMQMPDFNSPAAMTEGLALFAELTGEYPDKLNSISTMQKVGEAIGARAKQEGRDMQEPDSELMSQIMKVQGAIMFYASLLQQQKDPAYYGDRVTPEDKHAPLVRWKSGSSEYQVIFGDLHTETVTPERMTELESQLPRLDTELPAEAAEALPGANGS